MRKKIAALIRKELRQFVARAVERGVEQLIAESLAQQIETFGRYGFNLSHSAAYSILSYHTAWLKAHYPAEFMAAMLSAVRRLSPVSIITSMPCLRVTSTMPHP